MKQYNAMLETYREITVLGKPALFTCMMLDDRTVPNGLYKYDVRCDEYSGEPIELARKLTNEHYGTIITAGPIELDAYGRYRLNHYQDWVDEPYGGRANCVGRVEYLTPKGSVYGSCDYDDAEKFQQDVLDDLHFGTPFVLVLYKDFHGKILMPDTGWVFDEGFPPERVLYEQFPRESCYKVRQFIQRYRPELLQPAYGKRKGDSYAERVH